MFFIGDVHGKIREYLELLDKIKDASCMQLGDMGLGFPSTVLPRLKPQHQFIRGNHDDPTACKAHPNYAGDYGVWAPAAPTTFSSYQQELAKKGPYATNLPMGPPVDPNARPWYQSELGPLFYLGGAWSIDHQWRREYNKRLASVWHQSSGPYLDAMGPPKVWWEDEELSQADLDKAYELYVATKPTLVATHEAPTDAAKMVLSGGFRPEKADCANTRTSQALQKMLDAHQPKVWVFGHYHRDMSFDLKGCVFHCLNELTMIEVKD